MSTTRLNRITRRAFLQRSGNLALAGAAMPLAINLAAIGEAAAFDASDYKALVCVYMAGGNDHNNMVVPYDQPNYDRYQAARTEVALERAELENTALWSRTALLNDQRYALHPNMTGLASLFGMGSAAVVLNVGPLVVPVTKAQYSSPNRSAYPLPPKLFSHNDQTQVWQSQRPEGSTVGWGGRIGDLALSANADTLFTCISTDGSGVLLSGNSALAYRLSSSGAVAINSITKSVYGSTAVRDAMAVIATQPRGGILETEYNKITARSISAQVQVSTAMASASLTTAFPATHIGRQLDTVARLIKSHQTLGAKRQVFMVQLGGFDNHASLLGTHPRLMGEISAAMSAFYAATAEMGLANNVTAFTASEFGRTLTSNGDGSDHGWGSHHFIVGGAVKGAEFYGNPPPVSNKTSAAPEDQWHVGQGRLLPTTSVDQFAATLARWFGVADSELDLILPNLHNFDVTLGDVGYPRTLGFL